MEIQCYLYRAVSTQHKWNEGGGKGGGGGGSLLKSKIGSAEKRRTHENRSVSATHFKVALSNSLLLVRSSELSPESRNLVLSRGFKSSKLVFNDIMEVKSKCLGATKRVQ